ncbi:MAG: cation:proton antiporter [Thaumarchaeota archaeon]|nr:cation:proton antiporter [Nitrososphaerota archaeon]
MGAPAATLAIWDGLVERAFDVASELAGSSGLEPLVGAVSRLQEALAPLAGGDAGIAAAPVILLAAAVTIFFGVIGETFFKKTGIPDVAFLMMLGVAFGPVLGIIQPDVVTQIVPYFAAIALIIIMFDGGLNLDLKHMIRTAHFAILLALIGFVASVFIVTVMAHYALGWDWLGSILLGSIVGGSSSVIVFGLVRNLRISESAKNMLSFESAITDILSTIIAFIMFGAILVDSLSVTQLGQSVGHNLAVGISLGLVVGVPWLFVTAKLANARHGYMLTLGVLFFLYFLANALGESGALTALVFGILLGNKDRIARLFRFKMPPIERDDSMHNQLTFLVRAFFFVFVGLLASFGDWRLAAFGIAAAVAIYIARIVLSRIILLNSFSRLDRKVTSVMIPRGLAAAVLATLPLTYGLPNAEAYPQVAFFVILSTVIITTFGLVGAKKIPPPDPKEGGFVTPEEERPPASGLAAEEAGFPARSV